MAPGLHGVGPAPIRPGDVFVERACKEAAETELARGPGRCQDVPTVVAQFAAADGDPAKIPTEAAGERDPRLDPIADDSSSVDDEGTGDPAKRATVGEWRAFAVDQGMTAEEADGLTKDQLVERFGE